MINYLIQPFEQLVDVNGKPIVGAEVFVYNAGTTKLATVYSDKSGTIASNPSQTDTLGNVTLLADGGYSYDVYVYDNSGQLLMSKLGIIPYTVGTGGESYIGIGRIEINENIVSFNESGLATSIQLNNKQDKLIPGTNIEIVDNVINAIVEPYVGVGRIEINENIVSFNESGLATSAELNDKQDKLTAGTNITIVDNVINATVEKGDRGEPGKDNILETKVIYPDTSAIVSNAAYSKLYTGNTLTGNYLISVKVRFVNSFVSDTIDTIQVGVFGNSLKNTTSIGNYDSSITGLSNEINFCGLFNFSNETFSIQATNTGSGQWTGQVMEISLIKLGV